MKGDLKITKNRFDVIHAFLMCYASQNDKYCKKHVTYPFKFSFFLIIRKIQNRYWSNYEVLIISCCDAMSSNL